jgi:hypothetical protein
MVWLYGLRPFARNGDIARELIESVVGTLTLNIAL